MGEGYLYLSTVPKSELIINEEIFKNVPPILPVYIFLKESFGERCWHRDNNQANLTIDDPWLREPYGNLSYSSLLKEMNENNFHTTIAFVPWNYDRSEKEVVELFRNNPLGIR